MSDILQGRLDEAVSSVLSVHNPGFVITSWVLVAHATGWDDDGDSLSSYPMLMLGDQPDHVLLGLLQVANNKIRNVGRWAERDDDD